MFTKSALAIALVIGTASGAFAAPKKYSTNSAHDVFVNGKYVGSDATGRPENSICPRF